MNPLLCPLTTLLAYIDRTKYRRGKVDNLFVLVTTQQPRAASWETIVRWAKEIMKLAGLGTFKVHSSHATSSTSALLMGMPLDQIIAKVGWIKALTFIKYYMKPIRTNQHAQVNSENLKPKKPKNDNCFKDPHDYADFWVKHTPKNRFACNGVAEKVSTFKTFHAPFVSPNQKVYGPTPFTPLSPASTVGYGYDEDIPSTQESTVTSDSLFTGNDPFDFDYELALIQDC